MNGSKAAVGAAEGIKAPHNVIMEDRHTLTVSGISDVDSFDEQTVIVFTDMGELTVKGEGLHINRLSLEVGEIMIEGNISSLSYSDSKPTQEGGFWSRDFTEQGDMGSDCCRCQKIKCTAVCMSEREERKHFISLFQ